VAIPAVYRTCLGDTPKEFRTRADPEVLPSHWLASKPIWQRADSISAEILNQHQPAAAVFDLRISYPLLIRRNGHLFLHRGG